MSTDATQVQTAPSGQVDAPPPAPSRPVDSYENPPTFARRNADAGVWEFGYVLDGAHVVLQTKKLGGVDDDLLEQFKPGYRAWRAENAARDADGKSPLPPL